MRTIILTIAALLCASTLAAQSERAWELGIGGAVYQFNRIGDVRLTSSSEGHAVDVSLRHVVYAGNLHVAHELSNAFALDFQGSLGKIEKEWLTHLGLGLEWRLGHYFRSSLIDPYLRAGAGYMYKGHHILYSGERSGARWTMFNDHNKDGADAQHITPLTAGVGINMWLGNKVGIGFQGDYVYMPKRNVANSLQGTVRLLLRLGGKPRRPLPVVTYVDRPVEIERIVELPVELPVETMPTEVQKLVTIDKMVDNILFDYDSHVIRPVSLEVVCQLASLLLQDTSGCYLITGYTDARGTPEYNLRLSEQRAEALRNALIEQGVPGYMLKTKGAGMSISHAPGTAPDTVRQSDRKVTVEAIANREYWDQL